MNEVNYIVQPKIEAYNSCLNSTKNTMSLDELGEL